jgi:predicted transcriptional regulator
MKKPKKDYNTLFEFSHPQRMEILRLLSEERYTLSKLSTHLQITTAEVYRHLERLLSIKVVVKGNDSKYRMTPMGRIMLTQLTSLLKISENADFFNKYDLSFLPEYLMTMSTIALADVKVGIMQNISLMEDNIRVSSKILVGMAKEPSTFFNDILLEKAKQGVVINVIFSEIRNLPEFYIKMPNINVWITNDIPIFGGYGDEIAIAVLPDPNGKLDYERMLYSKDENFRFWLIQIFNYFKDRAEPYTG